jgi:hypothetical protein
MILVTWGFDMIIFGGEQIKSEMMPRAFAQLEILSAVRVRSFPKTLRLVADEF